MIGVSGTIGAARLAFKAAATLLLLEMALALTNDVDATRATIPDKTAICWRIRTLLVRYFIPLNHAPTTSLRIGSSTHRNEISASAKTTRILRAYKAHTEPAKSTLGRVSWKTIQCHR
ncbi:unannotated protein [freshwater metagenome]|uniref:Unannotated protein n=1 Tax=freshwater metagenome TaxID=449393 RepID=A0A6J7SYA3_9ZZZZ